MAKITKVSILRNGTRKPVVPMEDINRTAGIVQYDSTNDILKVDKDLTIDSLEVTGNAEIDGALEVHNDLSADSITAEIINVNDDLFVDQNVIIKGDLEVQGTTFSSDVENVQSEGDYIVLRANNPVPLANGDYTGLVFHNYNNSGKDALLVLDNSGTFRVATQGTEAVNPVHNTWLVDMQYFVENVDFSQATLMSETYPVTSYKEVQTDIKAYKDANDDHFFYDPNVSPIEYYDNITYSAQNGVQLAGNVVTYTPAIDEQSHDVHFYTQISFMEPSATDMEPILTRSESANLTNGAPLVWEASTEKAINSPASSGEQVWKSSIDPVTGNITYGWGQSSTGSSFVFATMADYNTAKLIPSGRPGHIPENALIIIKSETNYLIGDEQ